MAKRPWVWETRGSRYFAFLIAGSSPSQVIRSTDYCSAAAAQAELNLDRSKATQRVRAWKLKRKLTLVEQRDKKLRCRFK